MICSCLNAGFLFAEMCPLLRLPSTIHSLPRKHHKNRTWVRQAVSRLFCIRFSQHFSTLFFWIISQAKGRSLADGGLFCESSFENLSLRTFWSIYRRLSLWDIWGDAVRIHRNSQFFSHALYHPFFNNHTFEKVGNPKNSLLFQHILNTIHHPTLLQEHHGASRFGSSKKFTQTECAQIVKLFGFSMLRSVLLNKFFSSVLSSQRLSINFPFKSVVQKRNFLSWNLSS